MKLKGIILRITIWLQSFIFIFASSTMMAQGVFDESYFNAQGEIEDSKVAESYLFMGKVVADDLLRASVYPYIENSSDLMTGFKSNSTDLGTIFLKNASHNSIATIADALINKLTESGFLKATPAVLRGEDALSSLTWSLSLKYYIPHEQLADEKPHMIKYLQPGQQKGQTVRRFLDIGPKVDRGVLSALTLISLASAKTLTDAVANGLAAGVSVTAYNSIYKGLTKLLRKDDPSSSRYLSGFWRDGMEVKTKWTLDGRYFFQFMMQRSAMHIANEFSTLVKEQMNTESDFSGYFTIVDGQMHHLVYSKSWRKKLIEPYLDQLEFLDKPSYELLSQGGVLEVSDPILPSAGSASSVLAYRLHKFGGAMGDEVLNFSILASLSLMYSGIRHVPPVSWLDHALYGDYKDHETMDLNRASTFTRAVSHFTYTGKFAVAQMLREFAVKPFLRKARDWVFKPQNTDESDEKLAQKLVKFALTPCEKDNFCFVSATGENMLKIFHGAHSL